MQSEQKYDIGAKVIFRARSRGSVRNGQIARVFIHGNCYQLCRLAHGIEFVDGHDGHQMWAYPHELIPIV